MPGRLYTIGEVAKRVGVANETLRRYEDRGIIRPARVGNQGQRVFTDADIAAVKAYQANRSRNKP